jgi:hypothetical protein
MRLKVEYTIEVSGFVDIDETDLAVLESYGLIPENIPEDERADELLEAVKEEIRDNWGDFMEAFSETLTEEIGSVEVEDTASDG